jgi:D-3-phosphoglycerate dehydrogenase
VSVVTVLVSHPQPMLDMYFGQCALAALREIADVRLNAEPHDLPTPQLIDAARDCDVLIAYRQTPAPAALFDALPRLAAFLRCAMDIRTVDVDAASQAGVLVTRASAGFQAAVAEWIVAMAINLGRGLVQHAAAYHRGELPPPHMGRELRGATVGIVGYGAIGQRFGELALAFGARLLVHTPQPVVAHERLAAVPLDALLAASDFVVCLAPATPQTAGLMGAHAFTAMKPGAFFINASRGELVDEAALLGALDSGHLGGCALDVGLAPDQTPSPALARHPRVMATPHIGGLTPPAIEHQALETVEQLRVLLHGRLPEGAVNAAHATRWQRLAASPPAPAR